MTLQLLVGLAFLIAILYSSVGHGGASGYLAAMALAGMSPEEMKPTALVLNLLVAGVGTARYVQAGCFKWRTVWPFALGSVPFAWLGGSAVAPDQAYRRILGVVLLVAAVSLVMPRRNADSWRQAPVVVAVLMGTGIGYVSGLIGVGGGIFLSPLLILAGWATTRETLGISSLFILVNSAAGLLGHLSSLQSMPPQSLYLAMGAFAGGLLGSHIGAKLLPPIWVRAVLSAALILAAAKLLLSGA